MKKLASEERLEEWISWSWKQQCASLPKYLGLVLFEKQFEAVKVFMEGTDTFVALPTGYGKSKCH